MSFGTYSSNLKDLKNKVNSKKGGGIQRLKSGKPITIRFLDESTAEFFCYREHYDSIRKRYILCNGESNCPGCEQDFKASEKYLSRVYDVEEQKAYFLALPSTPVGLLLNREEKYKSLTDRNYEISQEGQFGQSKFVYDVVPEDKEPLKGLDEAAKKLGGHEEKLITAFKEYEALLKDDDSEEETEEAETPRKRSARSTKASEAKPAKKAKRNSYEEEAEAEEADDDLELELDDE